MNDYMRTLIAEESDNTPAALEFTPATCGLCGASGSWFVEYEGFMRVFCGKHIHTAVQPNNSTVGRVRNF